MQTTKIVRLSYQKPEVFERLKAAQLEAAKVWYGKDLNYFTYKFELAGISVLIGSERGTSSTCPECGHRYKPKGRAWNCPQKECSYQKKHRDLTGSLNMHLLAFGEKTQYPYSIKYLRPVQTGSSRCADTRQSSLIQAHTSSTSIEGNHLISAQSIGVVKTARMASA